MFWASHGGEKVRVTRGSRDAHPTHHHRHRLPSGRLSSSDQSDFVQVYDERFAPTRGPLTPGAQEAVYRYLDCGIFACGFARVRCGECGHDYFVAFSCKLRCICPSCHMKRELIWAEWAGQELLEEVPHRQVVLTIPKRLRPFFRYDRTLLGDLTGCAWRTLRLWVLAYFEDEAAVPGAIGFIQTAGELLNYHPHVHLLVTDGVFDRDGTFERFTFFDTGLIERLFRAEVLRMLTGKGLISQDVVENLMSWPHSGFSVHGDVRVPDRAAAARLGRYMIRCPIVLERLSLDEDTGEVLYRTRPSRAAHPEGPVARWDVYELAPHCVPHPPAHSDACPATRATGAFPTASGGAVVRLKRPHVACFRRSCASRPSQTPCWGHFRTRRALDARCCERTPRNASLRQLVCLSVALSGAPRGPSARAC